MAPDRLAAVLAARDCSAGSPVAGLVRSLALRGSGRLEEKRRGMAVRGVGAASLSRSMPVVETAGDANMRTPGA